MALHESFGSICAEVAEVSIEGGQVRVHRVVCAIDCGTVVNPDTVDAQLQSAIVYGLSATLMGEITLKDGRVQQRNVADGDIAACYAHAEVFVFPSLYEGFGIPILEAFSCGCPTLLARASCFPEIAGDAALYFDPQTPGSMAAALTRLLGDAALRDQLRARGRARAAEFTWERTTARTLDIYRALEATP